MNTTNPAPLPPTDQELERAMEVISRAAKAHAASGVTPPSLIAYREEQQKNRALAAKCDELQDPIYRLLVDALPGDLKELLGIYGLMVLAPYAVNKHSFGIFKASHRKAKKLMALQS